MAAVVARAEGLAVRHGSRTLGPFDIEVSAREIVALIGSNGAGKTTLLRLLLGIDRAEVGAATIGGEPVSPLRPPLGVGYVPDHDRFWDWASAQENLRPFSEDDASAEQMLGRVGLAVNGAPVRSFSRGMRQRLSLARALLTARILLVLDEPTIAIDAGGVEELATLLRDAAANGLAVLVATHDHDFASAIGSREQRIENGRTL